MNRKYILNPENTLAILIGIEHYEDFARVDPAPNNVVEFAKVLEDERILGLSKSRIETIIGGKSAQIKEKLFEIFEKLQDQKVETLIFYFVGHGFRRPNGDYYLAAEDSKKRLLRLDGSTGISYDTIKQIIESSRIPQKLIFLDSCYSGSTTLSGENNLESLRLKGTYTISSSDSREVSYFDPEHSHTLFTGELLSVLKSGLNEVGERIRLDELYAALKLAVKTRNPKMTPQQLGSQEITGGNYLFCKNLKFSAEGIGKTQIDALLRLGDEKLKARDLPEAEYQYLRAQDLAAKLDLLPDYREEIQKRMEKLRFAEEFKKDWKAKPEKSMPQENPSPPSPKNTPAEPTATSEKTSGSGQKKSLLIAGGVILAILLVFLAWQFFYQDNATTPSGEDPASNISAIDPTIRENGLSSEEVIQRIGQNMVKIEGGSYMQGCTFEQADDCAEDEKILREVEIPTFQLNRFEVTQEEWRAVMGADPAELDFPNCDHCPVSRVSWREILVFIDRLNEKTGKWYRLPTESEWEYAARGGSESKEYRYAGGGKVENVAWFEENSEETIHPVGQKAPNELGLYDMSGNVYEWVQDHYHNSYKNSPLDGSAYEHPDSLKRVLRGGSWDHPAGRARVSSRSLWRPDKRYKDGGFRLAHGL